MMQTTEGARGVTALAAALIAAAALALGAAGGFFWQDRAVTTVAAQRDALAKENDDLKAKVNSLDMQVKGLQDDVKELESQLEQATADLKALAQAVQVGSSARDVAVAYGEASVARNQPWMRALMTPELAASHRFRTAVPDIIPNRYAITREEKSGDEWTYVVRVWYWYKTEGDAGYTDDTLTVIKTGDAYKIKAISHADYVSVQVGK